MNFETLLQVEPTLVPAKLCTTAETSFVELLDGEDMNDHLSEKSRNESKL